MRAPRHLMRAWGGAALGACLALVLVSQVSAQQIVSARYDGPTDRYPHGVLGDEIEYDTLVVRLRDGREISARWAEEVVFEDIAPRVVDVDSDGVPAVVAVESHETKGARLAIWGLVDGALATKATTPFIGTRFRWLAPVAVADLDGMVWSSWPMSTGHIWPGCCASGGMIPRVQGRPVCVNWRP